jgi:hypothetical protein
MAKGISQTLAEMQKLKEMMETLAAKSDEGGEIDEAVTALDALAVETDKIDNELIKLNESRAAVVEKMMPYHELLTLTGHSHKTMTGTRKKAGGAGGSRGKVRDSKTGKVYGSGAEACRENGIEVAGASAMVKWKSAKGYDLERVTE